MTSDCGRVPSAPQTPLDDQPPVDEDSFKKALGEFATGVCVLTTRMPGERRLDVAMTADAFTSVSLCPRLVLASRFHGGT